MRFGKSKGGATDSKNCQVSCITHNRAKENRLRFEVVEY